MNIYETLLILVPSIWGAFEVWLMVRDRIQGKGTTARDRGTRYLNFTAIAVGLTGAVVFNGVARFFFPGRWTGAVFWAGLGVMVLGLALRVWAIVVLGRSFRTTIETHRDQQVVTRGPYKLVRHPSYDGLLLICAGYGIAVQNWLSLLVAVAVPLVALLYRIHLEEPVLAASLGSEYRAYQQRTKKLIPWVW
jgi:protein-S-isoprenylcysteine O-methyltransferase Ste14